MTLSPDKLSSPSSRVSGASTAEERLEMLAGYPDLLTVQHLRGLTGLSEQTIRAEINGGRLPGCRIGRRLFIPKGGFLEYVTRGGGLDG